jgi:hypothetical protein
MSGERLVVINTDRALELLNSPRGYSADTARQLAMREALMAAIDKATTLDELKAVLRTLTNEVTR